MVMVVNPAMPRTTVHCMHLSRNLVRVSAHIVASFTSLLPGTLLALALGTSILTRVVLRSTDDLNHKLNVSGSMVISM
jgi:hypothetical protein